MQVKVYISACIGKQAGRQAGRWYSALERARGREGERASGRAGERERGEEGGTRVNSVWIGGGWSRLIRF